jgi:hypothetical protein
MSRPKTGYAPMKGRRMALFVEYEKTRRNSGTNEMSFGRRFFRYDFIRRKNLKEFEMADSSAKNIAVRLMDENEC